MQRPITKIISDNDGVNADSEHLAMKVMDDEGYSLVKRFAPDANLQRGEIYSAYAGISTNKIVDTLIDRFKLDRNAIRSEFSVPDGIKEADYIADIITLQTIDRFRTELAAIEGIDRSWKKIQDKFGAENIALSTTSREDRMDITLECAKDPETGRTTNLPAVFPKGERRISGYGHPNKYTLAFENLGWDPGETVIIEDSHYGAEKAKQHSPDVRVIGTVAAGFYQDKPAQAQKLIEAGSSIVISHGADLHKALEWMNTGFDPAQTPSFRSKVYLPESEGLDNTLSQSGPRLRVIEPTAP